MMALARLEPLDIELRGREGLHHGDTEKSRDRQAEEGRGDTEGAEA